MTSSFYTPGSLVTHSSKTFDVYSDKPPKLLPTGLEGFDKVFGGLDPGSANILAADQSVGKSSAMLAAVMSTPVKCGVVTLEDSAAMVGVRLLAAKSGVNSLDILMKRMDEKQKKAVKGAQEALRGEKGFLLWDGVGANLEAVTEAIRGLAGEGCQIIWVDYLQKIRGVSEDRRNEVASVFTKCHSAAARPHGAALVGLSQVTDVKPGQMPTAHKLRETRDLANEARVILCACRPDSEQAVIHFYVEKCFHGASDKRTFWMKRDASGTLRPKEGFVRPQEECDEREHEF